MMKKETYTKFLIVWNMLGVEAVLNLNDIAEKRVEAVLKEEFTNQIDINPDHALDYFLLRARFNQHRNYEIYGINISDSITAKDIIEMFDNDPQHTAELIREKGVKFYGATGQNPVITH